MKTKTILTYLASAFLFIGSYSLQGAEPNWWTDYSLIDGSTRQDDAVATIGQAKHAVQKAYDYLSNNLNDPRVDLTELTNHYNQYCVDTGNDSAGLTIGQLKFLAKPFYDLLNSTEVGFDTSEMRDQTHGIYPWTATQGDDADSALATIGQLKFVFSFDLSAWTPPLDTDGDRIPDDWEILYGLNPSKSGYVGFLGMYFRNYHNQGLPMEVGGTFAKIQVDSEVSFNWGSGGPSGVDVHDFGVRWTGYVIPDFDQSYTFQTYTDDGVRLWVNDVLIIDKWHTRGFFSGTIDLLAGELYEVRMDYYEDGGYAYAYLILPTSLQLQEFTEADLDLDRDGLTTLEEYKYYTNPNLADTDGDGFADSENAEMGFNDPYSDLDNDGYLTWEEVLQLDTDPNVFNNSIQGFVLSEEWHNVSGLSVDSLRSSQNYPDYPSKQEFVTKLDRSVNQADNYGVRIQGYIIADITGQYYFQIASDNDGEFWLSTDDRPKNAILSAWVNGYTGHQQWNVGASQTSRVVTLIAGEYYFFELYMKEGSGGDHLSLRWHKPDGSAEIISSANLATFNPNDTDRDFVPDPIEQAYVDANPNDAITSVWDVSLDLNVGFATHTDILPNSDFDSDGFTNLEEITFFSNPADPDDYPILVDEDGDGITDRVLSSRMFIHVVNPSDQEIINIP